MLHIDFPTVIIYMFALSVSVNMYIYYFSYELSNPVADIMLLTSKYFSTCSPINWDIVLQNHSAMIKPRSLMLREHYYEIYKLYSNITNYSNNVILRMK